MPTPYLEDLRRDVAAVTRKQRNSLLQITRDLGLSEPTLRNWLRRTDVCDGVRPGITTTDSHEPRG